MAREQAIAVFSNRLFAPIQVEKHRFGDGCSSVDGKNRGLRTDFYDIIIPPSTSIACPVM